MTPTSHRKPRKLVMLLALIACVGLTGCAKTMGSAGTECARWSPIYWSKTDTDDTIKQVKEHNAVYKRLCVKK